MTFLLLLSAGVHALAMAGEQVLQQETLPAQVAHVVPHVAVKLHVQLQVVVVVEEFLALITLERSADFVLELEVVATAARHREAFLAQATFKTA